MWIKYVKRLIKSLFDKKKDKYFYFSHKCLIMSCQKLYIYASEAYNKNKKYKLTFINNEISSWISKLFK
jgi:hypothetical protein